MYGNQHSHVDGYPIFEATMQANFDKAIATGRPLFLTHTEDLNELYLSNIPEIMEGVRQHYTCHACRQFLQRFGSLVTINEDGITQSVLFNEEFVPALFKTSVQAMREAVESASVSGVFIPDARVLGTPKTGEWTHLHVKLPESMRNRSLLRNAYQAMAEKREDFNVLRRVSSQHTVSAVNSAIALLKSETVYRGDRYAPHAEWFRDVLTKIQLLESQKAIRNYLWLAAAKAPTGFIPSNSSNVGQLLGDIADGMSLTEAGQKLSQRLNPATFQRAQTPPKQNAILEHQRIFEKLREAGHVAEDSLKRRYAKYEEVPKIWEESTIEKEEEATPSGVFAHLLPKTEAKPADLPAKLMTWEKFSQTILPTAKKLEVSVDNPSHFMALVAADYPTAPNILQWDNGFSWYYHGGIDAEIKRRVEEAGGRYDDNEIRVSLMWEGLTDLDLHAISPTGEHIHFQRTSRKDRYGGYLDLDMNGLDMWSEKPVENMRWATNAPEGRYKFYVHNYNEKVNRFGGTPFKVELQVGDKIYTHDGAPLINKAKVTVFEFDYLKGQAPQFIVGGQHIAQSETLWGIPQNQFVPVKGITTSPNLWGDNPKPQAGTHIFFLLEGAKDESEGKGRGFFNEMLKPEFREIRRTLEYFTANAPINGQAEASAAGVGYSKDNDWGLTIRVTDEVTTRVIKIDRWD